MTTSSRPLLGSHLLLVGCAWQAIAAFHRTALGAYVVEGRPDSIVEAWVTTGTVVGAIAVVLRIHIRIRIHIRSVLPTSGYIFQNLPIRVKRNPYVREEDPWRVRGILGVFGARLEEKSSSFLGPGPISQVPPLPNLNQERPAPPGPSAPPPPTDPGNEQSAAVLSLPLPAVRQANPLSPLQKMKRPRWPGAFSAADAVQLL